jgi:hypothetical protein
MAGDGEQSKPRQPPPLPDLRPSSEGTSNPIICCALPAGLTDSSA